MLIALILTLGQQQLGGQWNLVHQFTGSQPGEWQGFQVELLGDLDGDNHSEVLVTSPLLDLGDPIRLGAVSVYSGANGTELFRVTGLDFPDATKLGRTAAALGDVNQDGIPDFAFAAAGSAAWLPYSVFVYSGAQFNLLTRLVGPPGSVQFGFGGIAGGQDLSGDGVPDIVVADDHFSGALMRQGAVFAYDSTTWQPLWSVEGSVAWERLGGEVGCVADVSGDGLGDVLVYSGISGSRGTVLVLDGLDGSEIYRITGPSSGVYLGIGALKGVGDLDGDNREDFAVDQNLPPGSQSSSGYVNIYSGIDGSMIHQIRAESPGGGYPGPVSSVGDIDGDGFTEITASSPTDQLPGYVPGTVYVYSSRDWAILARIPAPVHSIVFGMALGGGEDVDGDGWPDLAIGDSAANPNGIGAEGAAYVFSFDPYLRTDASAISAGSGGQLTFDLQFPPSEAGKEYRLLASTDRPGSTIMGHLEIPLVATELTYAAIHDPRSWFTGTTGFLDSNGQATAVAQVAPGTLTNLIGKTIKLAAVSLRPPKKPTVSSAAVFVEVLP